MHKFSFNNKIENFNTIKDKDLNSACLHKMRVNSVTRNPSRREALKRQGVRQQTPKWKQLFGNNK